MKKVLKLTGLALAALMCVCPLASCTGSGADTTAAPNTVADDTTSAQTEAQTTADTTKSPEDMTDEEYFAAFTPVLRFIAASDVHIEDGATVERTRLAQLFTTGYTLSESDTVYSALDAVCFAGDICNTGTPAQFKAFKTITDKSVKGETEVLPVIGNHEFFGNNDPKATFKETFGLDASYHTTVNGFHFIFVASDNGSSYGSATRTWLKEQIESAIADDPTGKKPVFVFQHHHVSDTVYGSTSGWGVSDLSPVLKKYPNVVDFSGHSHFPINDPKSIWQGSYTALGTGTLSYYEMALGSTNSVFPSGKKGEYRIGAVTNAKDAAQFYIVEADANGSMVIKMYDLLSDSYMCEPYYIRTPSDPSAYTYTNARAKSSGSPSFAEGAKLTIADITQKGATVTIPQAADDEVVWYYKIVTQTGGKTVSTGYLLSGYYYLPIVESVEKKLTGLSPLTEYTVKVTAYDAWENESTNSLTATFTTSEGTEPTGEAKADVFDALFADKATDRVSGKELTPYGAPVIKDGKLTLDGSSAYTYDDFSDFYPELTDSLSMELYIKFDELGSPYVDAFANMESGGFGFEITADGTAQFWINVNGTYVHPQGKIKAGEYVHLLGTFNGESACLYINGELVDTVAANGTLSLPVNNVNYLVIGGDSSPDGPSAYMKGEVACARVYSSALGAKQAADVYAKCK